MSRRLVVFGFLLLITPCLAWVADDEKVTLFIPGVQCVRCAESLSGSLGKIDSSIRVGGVGVETKQVEVTYNPTKVSVQQLVTAVAAAEQIHGKPYQGWLVIKIEDAKTASKLQGALKKVKGVIDVQPTGATPGEVAIAIAPLTRQAKLADQVKASQIAEALEKAGVKFSGLPGVSAAGTAENDPKKKQPAAKGTAKTKPGEGDSTAEKTKPARPATSTTKTKPAGSSPTKSKDDESEEKPRFQILAGDEDKVYLIDHETKSDEGKELKKLVKEGDMFGDFIVKEVGDDDGLYVVLEHAETKETTRVEKKKKEKDKDGDKPTESKEKETGDKDKGDEKKDNDAN